MTTEVIFIAPLSNFYSETELHFKSGLRAINLRADIADNLIANLEGLSQSQAIMKLARDYNCIYPRNEGRLITEQTASFITNTFTVEQTIETGSGNEVFSKLMGATMSKGTEYRNELNRILNAMHLFKEGAVRVPKAHFFFRKDGVIHEISSYGMNVPQGIERHTVEPYNIDKDEVEQLYTLIDKMSTPFSQDYINLCHENFELSYNVSNYSLAFLSLVTALEVLFNDGEGGATYKLARSTAALLAKDSQEFDKIYKDMKGLYSKRSRAVHRGIGKDISGEDILHVRDYVRRAILAANAINKNKNDLLDYLNQVGFKRIHI